MFNPNFMKNRLSTNFRSFYRVIGMELNHKLNTKIKALWKSSEINTNFSSQNPH
jgi:hypothetical protein